MPCYYLVSLWDTSDIEGGRGLGLFAVSCCLHAAAQSITPKQVQAIFAHGERLLRINNIQPREKTSAAFFAWESIPPRCIPIWVSSTCARAGRIGNQDARKCGATCPHSCRDSLESWLAYFREREFRLASRYFGEVLSLEPNHVQARYLQGICGFMTDDFQAAVDSLQPLYAQEASDLEYLFMLGISDGMLKRTEESQQVFAQLVRWRRYTSLTPAPRQGIPGVGGSQRGRLGTYEGQQRRPLPYALYYSGIVARNRARWIAQRKSSRRSGPSPTIPGHSRSSGLSKWIIAMQEAQPSY